MEFIVKGFYEAVCLYLENIMDGFWNIISEWTGAGQFLIMLVIIGTLFALMRNVIFYLTVFVHGWPPPNTPLPDDLNEPDELEG